ncbi:AraC family transcriptional regulator [Indioceanicola profundi]|uniref:AraC family transcriptional regulator n=1 Tax=Indioceanicola profundi TaxID=2220096 RepID=UPI000E6ADA04|nr:helix-turn-helix domain-containing protein [Indioceanicola profundi]
MDLGQLDAALRLGGMTMLLFLAWLLFRQRRTIGMPALLFPPMAICLSGFLTGNTPDLALRLSGAPGAIAHFASGCTVVFLWWFCLACFDRQFRPRGGVLAVGLCWIALAAADRAIADPAPALSYTLVGLGFGIVAHLVWRLYAEREGDLIQKRHDARAMIAMLLGGLLLTDLSIDLVFGFAWRPLLFAMAQNVAILGFSLWLAGRVLTARSDVLSFDGAALAAPSPLPPTEDIEDRTADGALRQRLAALMEVERIHLDPDLTFAMFVQRMNAPERAVRKLVNHELGFDHFRSFLNHYRVMEARKLLADPGRSADKLIAIALDSGFASLPSFNRVFRANEACTPGEYRDAALAARSTAQNSDFPAESSSGPCFEKRSAAF